jgi:hypothetical protein
MPDDSPTHIVLLSGGMASFEAGRRVAERYGMNRVRCWFFDTQIEDEDLYRFLADCAALCEVPLERFADGRHPWAVFRAERFIGNSQVAVCNRVLKRTMLERLLRQQYPAKNVVLHFGLEQSEEKRRSVLAQRWVGGGYQVDFPLTWSPMPSRADLWASLRTAGIEPPRMYQLGFGHNNCGGACVKAGIHQWVHLFQTFPERYVWHEEQEQLTREYLGKDVSILRDRVGGHTRPLTLSELRHRIEYNGILPSQLSPTVEAAIQEATS